MADVVQLGPFVIASDRLLTILAIWLFLAFAWWQARRHPELAGRAPWIAVLVGVVVARAAFVLQNRTAFAESPLDALYLWQSGFSPLLGIGAAAAVVALFWKGPGRLITLGVLLAIGSAALLTLGVLHRDAVRPLPGGLVATDMTGQSMALQDLAGRPFVINLWATWCPPCRREMPMLAQVAAASPKVPILLVNQGEDMPAVRAFLTKQKLPDANILLDRTGAFGTAINSPALPTTIFVDGTGKIRRVHAGEISRATLLAGIQDIEESSE
ncbi:TlpA disulfide reductase family protein [Sphingomonas sp. BE137]|jgi:cytochrome c biogenesis protein CcmG/thiol:disulfide interchange protein DsbE|uniref:TlpA disulfide reductase family protein n=1 Tax=Sphingomonas sp. BE137 TaxID=2817844 RepID=UPI001AE28629|nr:TlpA disulfide reductase family protein [Sphingomonas sp. BE137]MDR6846914.1 thiol-disulfide isomerase/thioredoxin [Sphingomonas sp. BE137]